MKVLYYDCFAGISGDMNLGAMIDLGVSPDYLKRELSLLGLDDEFELVVTRKAKMGITGTRAEVKLLRGAHDHPHPHRHLSDVEAIIGGSGLDGEVRRLSLEIFGKIAIAESGVHGIPPEEVHFHEVGATDSLVDIVGAAICYRALGVDEVWSRPPELGGGFVDCAHGRMPVPAPATAELVKNMPVSAGAAPFETTTPTGAAILSVLVKRFTGRPDFTIRRVGYGLGMRDMEIPNLLRVYIAETDTGKEGSYVLECNIDDMNPEHYEHISEKLFGAGANDVFLSQIIMKKGRPAVKISVLTEGKTLDEMKQILYTETPTLGMRIYPVEKDMLERSFRDLETPYGKVRIKNALKDGKIWRSKPEWEDCRRIATEHNLPLPAVYRLVERLLDEERKKEEGKEK